MATRMGQELADQLASAINAAVSQADGNIIQAQDAITEAILAAGTKVIDYEQSIFRAKEGRQQAREVRGAELADLEKNRKESYEFKKDAMRRGRKILHIATALKALTALGGEALKYWANPPKKVAETKKPGDYVQDQPTVSEDILGKEPLGFTSEERSRYTTAPSFQEYFPPEQAPDTPRTPMVDQGSSAPWTSMVDQGSSAPWTSMVDQGSPTTAIVEDHKSPSKKPPEYPPDLLLGESSEARNSFYSENRKEYEENLNSFLATYYPDAFMGLQRAKEKLRKDSLYSEAGPEASTTPSPVEVPEAVPSPASSWTSMVDQAPWTSMVNQAPKAAPTPAPVEAPRAPPTPTPVSSWASMVDQAPWTSMVNQAPPSSPPSTAAQGLDAGKQLPPTSEAVAPKAAPAGSALAQEALEQHRALKNAEALIPKAAPTPAPVEVPEILPSTDPLMEESLKQQRALDDAIKASLPPSPVAKEALAQKKDPATEKPIDSPEFSLSLKEDPGESVDSWAKEGAKEIPFDPMDLVPFETREGTPALLPRKFAERLKRFFAFAAEHGITLTLGGQDSGARDSAAFARLYAKGLKPSREGYHSHKKDHRAVDIEVGGSFNSDEYKFIKEHGVDWGILPGHTRPDQASSESPFKNYRKPWHHIFSVDIPADSPFAPGSDYWKYKSRKNVFEREKNRSATDDELWKLLDLGGS